jgi:hypothetical protein
MFQLAANLRALHSVMKIIKDHLHRPPANLSCFQKSALYPGIRIFNSLPCILTNLKKEKTQFKVALRRYLNAHSFCYADEFFTCTDNL